MAIFMCFCHLMCDIKQHIMPFSMLNQDFLFLYIKVCLKIVFKNNFLFFKIKEQENKFNN